MPGPVEGIRVVELGIWVAGPAAGGILADWGADVIKIEAPSGDPGRMFGRMLGCDLGVNPPFEMDNRSKRSVVLDLTTEHGRSTALELISDADVFLTNVRPGAFQRLQLDFETVAAHNPRLVYGEHVPIRVDFWWRSTVNSMRRHRQIRRRCRGGGVGGGRRRAGGAAVGPFLA